jgi:DNA polymerase I-like protein with 3'-5' exonuclease and polymerase domains
MYQISLEHQDLLELWIEVNRYSAVVSEMQTNGILIDLFSCKQYSQEAQHRRDKIHGEMIDMVGKSFNPRSVPQLR